mgnify:CR=1 FL=1
MTNLNSYTIENSLYRLGDTYTFYNDTLKIESIVSVLDTVYFFCSRINGKFTLRIAENKSVVTGITAINSLIFHHNSRLLVEKTQ